jgi:catechol 2,3-dioxygenase-like lactoylglutathione lyase family enzyme
MRDMKFSHRCPVVFLIAGLTLVSTAYAKDPAKSADVQRPPIVGVAWIGLRTADMAATRKFYTGYLGLGEQTGVKDGGLTRAVFKVNDRQYIQVLPELKDPNQNRLIEIAFETANAEQLRAYMASRDVKVPEKVENMGLGTKGFSITDIEDHLVKFVQFTKVHTSKESKPDNRVSTHMIHTGFIVNDRAGADHLFKDILGFTETWHGGMTDDKISWVDMRVPEGKDWLEYMLNYANSDVRISGIMNHLALGVPSVEQSYQTVVKRGLNPEKPKIGRDGKWQLNLYGPDLTRVELMEPKPVQTPCCSPMLQ